RKFGLRILAPTFEHCRVGEFMDGRLGRLKLGLRGGKIGFGSRQRGLVDREALCDLPMTTLGIGERFPTKIGSLARQLRRLARLDSQSLRIGAKLRGAAK